MAIKYYNEDSAYRLAEKRRLARWVADAIAEEGFVAGDISYIFCSSARHLEINREFLGHDYYTDVITFDYGSASGQQEGIENPGRGAECGDAAPGIVSGDIFIDPLTVEHNAIKYGSAKIEEMRRVLIHGVLHLCGYKDKTREEKALMREKENYYLAKLSLP